MDTMWFVLIALVVALNMRFVLPAVFAFAIRAPPSRARSRLREATQAMLRCTFGSRLQRLVGGYLWGNAKHEPKQTQP